MILPIYIYDDKILSKSGETLTQDYPNLKELIDNMFETMYQASGIGLAAQQIGLPLKLFIVDIGHYNKGDEALKDFKKVFINSEVIEVDGEDHAMTEGCLSFPGLNVEVTRKTKVRIKYLDENFIEHDEWFDGLAARCIQHEHDHVEGKTFILRTTPFHRTLLEGKLKGIKKRNFQTNYKCKI